MAEQAESQKPEIRLVAQPVKDPRLEAINDQIAELVAEALFNRLVKNVLENKDKPRHNEPDGKKVG